MGRPFADVSISENYRNMVDDERIGKTYIDAREFFMTLAELQFESGYPYMVFEDTVNRANPIDGRIAMSNLCSEILQVQEPSTYHEDLSYDTWDVTCPAILDRSTSPKRWTVIWDELWNVRFAH